MSLSSISSSAPLILFLLLAFKGQACELRTVDMFRYYDVVCQVEPKKRSDSEIVVGHHTYRMKMPPKPLKTGVVVGSQVAARGY